jgi:hypothetical protein
MEVAVDLGFLGSHGKRTIMIVSDLGADEFQFLSFNATLIIGNTVGVLNDGELLYPNQIVCLESIEKILKNKIKPFALKKKEKKIPSL